MKLAEKFYSVKMQRKQKKISKWNAFIHEEQAWTEVCKAHADSNERLTKQLLLWVQQTKTTIAGGWLGGRSSLDIMRVHFNWMLGLG